jgi:hypothetical protein
VKAYREAKAILTKDFFELVKLEGSDPDRQLKHSLKEQEIGQHCYEAEEDLNTNDLEWLKLTLGIGERKWQAYKANYVVATMAEEKLT